MFQNILGIFLIIIPFGSIFFYSSKIEGFLRIMIFASIFHLIISIITQALHIFSLPLVLSLNFIFDLGLFLFLYKRCSFNFKHIIKNNWLLLASIVIIFSQLFLVHYNYTGPAQSIRGKMIVSNSSYYYPFVSDEWVTIAEINYSINEKSLPLVNPLDHNISIPNILFAFPSVLSELFLVSSFNPLVSYWIFSILIALFLCCSVYFLLRVYKINPTISALTILFIPYITNSGNLLALWSLLPFTFGTIFLIWQLIAQKLNHSNFSIIFVVIGLIFYPPMFVFSIPVLIYYLFKNSKKWKIIIPIISSALILLAIFFISLQRFGFKIWDILSEYVVRSNLDGGIVSYQPWNILPWIVLILFIFGLYQVITHFKKYFDLVIILAIGFIFWIIYSFIMKVIFIEDPRVIFITSIFIIFFAGVGIERIINFISDKIAGKKKDKRIFLLFIGIVSIVIFSFLIPQYPVRLNWQKLSLKISLENGNKKIILPAPPVNRYLINQDLEIFRNIKDKNFIAPPRKGLVIGVSTNNYPFESKPATIANKIFSYFDFMNLSCFDKKDLAEKYNISYVYSEPFLCPGFDIIARSPEDLYLFKFK